MRHLDQLPPSTPAAHRAALTAAVPRWRASLGERLVSIALFGSVARGVARDDSDIDVVIIARDFPTSLSERRRPLLADWRALCTERGLAEIEWNLVTKTPEEARYHSPLYLDIVEDGILLFDRDRFFQTILDEMRARMRELGSRRVFLPDGTHYWDLTPDFRFGEIVEI